MLTGFYMIKTFTLNGLKVKLQLLVPSNDVKKNNTHTYYLRISIIVFEQVFFRKKLQKTAKFVISS